MDDWEPWRDDWDWARVVFVVAVLVVAAAAVIFSDEWPTVLVAIAAVVVAYVGILVQRAFAVQQTKLAEQQVALSNRQAELSTILQRLAFAPVLTGTFTSDGVCVKNVGKGPAYDLRVTAFSPSDGAPRRGSIHQGAPHLAPGDVAEVTGGGPAGADVRPDVWIVHCADMMGKPHYHAWCNWTRDDKYDADEPFIFETLERSPRTIRRKCLRCCDLGFALSEPPSG